MNILSGVLRSTLVLTAMVPLANCTPPASQYDYLRQSFAVGDGLEERQAFAIDDADCQAETRRFEASIFIGNFGGKETRDYYLNCMTERGWVIKTVE